MALRKNSESRPQISDVSPPAAIPGGEFRIRGKSLAGSERPIARFGSWRPHHHRIGFVGDRTRARRRSRGELVLGKDDDAAWTCDIGIQIAEGLHPVSNPVVDPMGNIYVTFSGAAGQKTPVSIYKLDAGLSMKPLVSEMMNATGLALDAEGALYVSSRHDGMVYQVSPSGNTSTYVEGMAWPPASSSTVTTISLSATAAEPFSRSAANARFMCSPRWRRLSPPITWRSVRTNTFT
jgi:hypothetical protein